MSDYGTLIASDTVRFERLLPGPIERVWAYLTESDKRGTWLASGAVEPRIGGQVELHFLHSGLSPLPDQIPAKYKSMEKGASFTARVTRWEPPRLLSHSWPEPSGNESEVTFELTPQGAEILLAVTHRRLGTDQMASAAGGWHTHLDILVDRMHGRVPQPFFIIHTPLEAEYEARIASAT
ncbi:MAG: SRPBCC family protein [Inquilinus limosus]|uniref:SRPBCC family protein n=1 Tax=Inquilinus limosus TaxID=171674 RepID=A0A952FM49_9PROT|nr:SRPBCC family protein [Inquilinus limosus]